MDTGIELRNRAGKAVDWARNLSIKSVRDFTETCELIKGLRKFKDDVESFMSPMREAALAAHRAVKEQESALLKPVATAEEIVKRKLRDYAVENDVPKVPGVYLRGEPRKWKITDESLVPRQLMSPDKKKIDAYVRAMGDIGISGIEVEPETKSLVMRKEQ